MFDGNYPTLVLNADAAPVDYFPLSTWHWQESVTAAIQNRVSVLAEHDCKVHSEHVTINIPSVVMLRDYVKRKHRPSFTRTNLIVLRDKCCCGYCGQTFEPKALTYDHVIPRAQNGKHTWENVITACLPCNQRKGNRTPQQAKMPLLWRPYMPSTQELCKSDFYLNQRKLFNGWQDYLPLSA